MVKNPNILRRFEKEQIKKEKISFRDALNIFESLWFEALSLGIVKKTAKLEGIEKELRIAKIINGL